MLIFILIQLSEMHGTRRVKMVTSTGDAIQKFILNKTTFNVVVTWMLTPAFAQLLSLSFNHDHSFPHIFSAHWLDHNSFFFSKILA